MNVQMFTCPKCRESFTMNELIDFWGYDVGDFQLDIKEPIEEPEWMGWDEFFKSHEISMEENNEIDYGYPIGNVGV